MSQTETAGRVAELRRRHEVAIRSPSNRADYVAALRRRHEIACELKQTVDRSRIITTLSEFFRRISGEVPDIGFAGSADAFYRHAEAISDTGAAANAWGNWWSASNQKRGWWGAQKIEDARTARDARTAAAAWEDRAIRAARAVGSAPPWRYWDLSNRSIAAIGAAALGDDADLLAVWLPVFEAFEAGAWLLAIADRVTVALRPELVLAEPAGTRRRLHSAVGPAFVWEDISEFYWHGVRVPEDVIERPETITVAGIDGERNVEVRRVLIERYRFGEEISGPGAYLRDAGAIRLDHDDGFGTLWRRDVSGDEPIVMVEVVNASPEPDGRYRHFFLRVHPELRPLPPGHWDDERKRVWLAEQTPQEMTARNAVASTWGLRGEDYRLILES